MPRVDRGTPGDASSFLGRCAEANVTRLNHIHIKSKDARAAVQWFVDNFGLEKVMEASTGDDFIVGMVLDGVPVYFTQHAHAASLPPGDAGIHLGLEHLGLEVEDLDALLERLKKKGVEVLEPPQESPIGARYAFIEGPDATRLEVIEKLNKE